MPLYKLPIHIINVCKYLLLYLTYINYGMIQLSEIAVDSDYNNGSTLIFRFISLAKFNDGLESLPFSVQQNQLVTALKLSFSGGVTLQCKEKSGMLKKFNLFLFYGTYMHAEVNTVSRLDT